MCTEVTPERASGVDRIVDVENGTIIELMYTDVTSERAAGVDWVAGVWCCETLGMNELELERICSKVEVGADCEVATDTILLGDKTSLLVMRESL
jgi:hypothetical protein